MAKNSLTWLRIAAVVALAMPVASQQQAKCYYPNGNAAPNTEKPCSSAEGSACCPDKWECLDNGLCHYPADNLYGRYSCTDKDWNSPGCASSLCTYDLTLGGGESITQCGDHNNDWCCNGDAQHVNCCKESPSPRPFFALPEAKAYATIGSKQAASNPTISTITGLASGTGSGTSPSKTPIASSTMATRIGSMTRTGAPFTSIQMSVSSGTAGVITVPVTIIVTPASIPTAASDSNNSNNSQSGGGSNSKIGLIVGCAVGIPLGLALIGILIWLLRKRRQQKANPYKETPDMNGDGSSSPGFTGGAAAALGKNQAYRNSRPDTSEIDGQPVGPTQPISTINGHAELESGTAFRPGHGTPYAPDTVGLGGGNGNGNDRSTWGSVPPQYSPGANQTAFSQHANVSELDSTAVLPIINEKAETQQYQAYRPPVSQQPIAELPTVKTPPEDVEKQIHH